jgi:hypothetical protein
MEKATALPLRAWFILNSPMPMLDVRDWLLLTTVLTTGGGRMATELFLGASWLASDYVLAALPWMLPSFIFKVLPLLMVVVVNLCFVVFCDFAGRHF